MLPSLYRPTSAIDFPEVSKESRINVERFTESVSHSTKLASDSMKSVPISRSLLVLHDKSKKMLIVAIKNSWFFIVAKFNFLQKKEYGVFIKNEIDNRITFIDNLINGIDVIIIGCNGRFVDLGG